MLVIKSEKKYGINLKGWIPTQPAGIRDNQPDFLLYSSVIGCDKYNKFKNTKNTD